MPIKASLLPVYLLPTLHLGVDFSPQFKFRVSQVDNPVVSSMAEAPWYESTQLTVITPDASTPSTSLKADSSSCEFCPRVTSRIGNMLTDGPERPAIKASLLTTVLTEYLR